MKYIIGLMLFLFSVAFAAQKVEVTADSMKAMESKKEIHFTGNVHIKQGESWLHGEKVVVHFNENNETDQYEAIGDVTFEIKSGKRDYKGNAQRVIYYPLKSRYILKGDATIHDLVNQRHIRGEEVLLDMKSGNATIKGKPKKPVKFIFDMEKKGA